MYNKYNSGTLKSYFLLFFLHCIRLFVRLAINKASVHGGNQRDTYTHTYTNPRIYLKEVRAKKICFVVL